MPLEFSNIVRNINKTIVRQNSFDYEPVKNVRVWNLKRKKEETFKIHFQRSVALFTRGCTSTTLLFLCHLFRFPCRGTGTVVRACICKVSASSSSIDEMQKGLCVWQGVQHVTDNPHGGCSKGYAYRVCRARSSTFCSDKDTFNWGGNAGFIMRRDGLWRML